MTSQQPENPVRVRFAPSPTGLLHVGNLRTGLFAWVFARQAGGVFILRIEDTDRERSEKQFEDFIYRDLGWFGMDWDEGPDVDGPFGPYRQSERFDLYRAQAEELVRGGQAFRCFCREEDLVELAEHAKRTGASWRYPGTCHGLTEDEVRTRSEKGEPFVLRLRVRAGPIVFDDIVHGEVRFSSDVISDPILLRSDGTPTYNYAVVIDDALMEISHVIRGDDHLSNTPKQVLIYEALGRRTPRFAHLSTILGPDQTRLSKRHGVTSIEQCRKAGYLPEALMNYIALLGWSPGGGGSEVVPRDRLIREFRLDRVNKNPAIFDMQKLNFINRHYMREDPSTIGLVREALADQGMLPDTDPDGWAKLVVDTLIGGVDMVSEVPTLLETVLSFPLKEADLDPNMVEDPGVLDLIRQFRVELDRSRRLTFEDFQSIVRTLKQSTGKKGRHLFHPLRVALTARSSGPELDKLIPLVEKASELGVVGVPGCRERVEAFLSRYG